MKSLFDLVPKFAKAAKQSSKALTKNVPEKNDSSLNLLVKSLGGLPTHVVDGVKDVVGNVTDYLKVAEQEKTKRTDITAKRDVALASVQAQREVFSELLKYTFKERAVVLQKQFDALDYALANGNSEIVNSALNAMVNVIQTSPFKSIQEMQQALGNKDFVVRLE